MEVNRLLGDELSYELYIRGLSTEGNVCDKRSVLRGALRCEKSGYVTLPNISNLDPERELTICDNKLIELSDEVNKFDIQNRHNDYKRINSRLVYITSRIGRITCNDLQRDIQSRLQARCMQVIDLLNEVYENSLNFEIVHLPEGHGANSILDEPNCLLPEISRDRLTSQHANALIDLDDAFENQNNVSRDTRVSFAKESYARGDQEDMINGSLGSHPIDNFSKLCNFGNSTVDLDTRFRKLSFSPLMGGNNNHLRGNPMFTGIPKEQIFRSVPEIFVGEALHWFRVNRFDSWDDLIGQLKEQFLPYDYDDKIRKEIERPRIIEETELQEELFQPPPKNYDQLMEPDLAYRGLSLSRSCHSRAQVAEVSTIPSPVGLAAADLATSTRTEIRCWNCGNAEPSLIGNCVLANGQSCDVLGVLTVPVSLEGQVKVVELLVVPSLPQTLILGADFISNQNITANLARREWYFDGDQNICALGGIKTFEHLSCEQKARSEALQDVFKDVRDRLKAAYERSRKYYNLRHRDEQFQLRQKVWRRNYVISDASKNFTAKLAPKFTGPLTVIDILSPWSYRLADNTGKDCGVWHARDLKSHPPDEGSCPSFVGAWCELSPPEACERDVA
ncbi:hypothetical protein NQ314_020894 [Rhamnusium bicolor]|uniref:Uncharacterized protein n=1 Tax=Rhamnusium bicolor TaxID=1586634 RepID=A0AAV8WJD8_9CUCU|nr:hypothetical protein NQ314_020894 [Rhamnusium bicolor]